MQKKIYGISILIFGFDQLFKYFVTTKMTYLSSKTIIPHFFSLHYLKNTGGAFSLFSESPWLLLVVGILFLIGVGCYLQKKETFSLLEILSFGFIIGGVIGNLWDRILKEGVIDYLRFQFGTYHFPVFNFADICIVGGVFLLGFDMIVGGKNGNCSNRK